MDTKKSDNLPEIWQQRPYYKKARQGSLKIDHPGMKVLSDLAKKAKKTLDLGCGEGTRLNLLVSEKQKAVGVDISPTSIEMARKAFPKIDFRVANLEKLPFADENFDLVYSAYVLEHLKFPEKVLKQAIRVIARGGYLVLIAPNFGAPNRASPPFTGSRIKKFFFGFIEDWQRLWFSGGLNWRQVESIADGQNYDVDWDTTVEPYLGSLLSYLKFHGLQIMKASSCWSEELPETSFLQRFLGILGKLNIYPFWMWGPHLLVVANKSR